ncbi:type II toxin-antitoxin system VapC family toxin [uncultured Nocardioides sp.]|mgnify:FL=1|uniref:type II toxin-antitoxin system VapC family toxin n=1 Tax=uncultured Nocardioides sp. TaxID=198441 RepID=UPI0026197D62|nr:type II toxin-antitoxin system VapC family toxin [uncultured Nocardioides sp.]
MIVDTSALVAVLRDEPDAERLLQAMIAAAQVRVSTATLVEAGIVLGPTRHGDLDELLRGVEAVADPVDEAQVAAARGGYARFGKGSGSPARLNLGDAFSYALASVTGEPLLFKGDDFTHTDVTPAVTR